MMTTGPSVPHTVPAASESTTSLHPSPFLRLSCVALACAALAAFSGCVDLVPDQKAAAPSAPAWLEAPPGWMSAAPADTLTRGPWWALFGDPVLDTLAPQVAVSNQTVAAAAAAVEESFAAVREQRAAFFPTISLTGSGTRTGTGGHGSSASGATTVNGTTTSTSSGGNRFSLGLGASWEPDVWGRITATVSAATATAQASEADLANATLSAQTTFVTDYLSVREADSETAILRTTIEAYQRSLKITQNRYAAAIAPRSDVLQAQTQLATAQASLAALIQQRAQFFHAMAVLAGQPPATFQLPPGDWQSAAVPAVPVGVPSDLLQRRPDIAAAERQVAVANDNIGVARAAYFPSLTLSSSATQGANRLGDLFNASAFAWSLGISLAETIFDGGARSAQVDEARANWKQSVAQYRQTALTAFSGVEDQLSAATSYEQQEGFQRAASQAADLTEQEMRNQYAQGLVAYTDVVTTQAAALSARRALMQASLNRQTAAVALIAQLGGGWTTAQLTTDAPPAR